MLGNSTAQPPTPTDKRGSANVKKRPRSRTPGSASSAPAEPKKPKVVHADESERSAHLLRGLSDYLENCGGSASMVNGWYTRTEFRKVGATAGTYDTYFFTPTGKRFRSKAEIARYFDLEVR